MSTASASFSTGSSVHQTKYFAFSCKETERREADGSEKAETLPVIRFLSSDEYAVVRRQRTLVEMMGVERLDKKEVEFKEKYQMMQAAGMTEPASLSELGTQVIGQ